MSSYSLGGELLDKSVNELIKIFAIQKYRKKWILVGLKEEVGKKGKDLIFRKNGDEKEGNDGEAGDTNSIVCMWIVRACLILLENNHENIIFKRPRFFGNG